MIKIIYVENINHKEWSIKEIAKHIQIENLKIKIGN